MKYLIDTHILIWYIEGNYKLSNQAIEIINNPNNKILISNVSLWEITIKSSIKKLELLIPISELETFLIEKDIFLFQFDYKHLDILHSLPFYHNDPFDRLIISQAIAEDLVIITDDSQFKNYNVKLY